MTAARKVRQAGLFLTMAVALIDAQAQVCQLSVAGLNRDRRVMGPVSAECPHPIHTSPFGNWGVTSNFGEKLDGHQFDGWCHDSEITDNAGNRRMACRDGWYEWNSCTTDSLFLAPNCSLYNAAECTQQVTTTGVNVLGTQTIDIPVRCPRDNDGDSVMDEGGCADVNEFSNGPNFMTLYELDPFSPDELIQTLHFPQTPVRTECGVFQCGAAGSEWMAPTGYDSPVSPPKVYAEMAIVVNSGLFIDPQQVCLAVARPAFTVSAASFFGGSVAPESIVSTFGNSLAEETGQADGLPLPFTLAGVSVEVTDADGVAHDARLLFVAPGQANWIVPASTAPGLAVVTVRDAAGVRVIGETVVSPVAPALFSADSSGGGVAAAIAVRVRADGSQLVEAVFRCSGPGACETVALDAVEPDGQVVLVLFGTGIRGRQSLGEVRVTIGGIPAEVYYAGPQPEFPGLDQVNVRIPAQLAGRGLATIEFEIAGRPANAVTVRVR